VIFQIVIKLFMSLHVAELLNKFEKSDLFETIILNYVEF